MTQKTTAPTDAPKDAEVVVVDDLEVEEEIDDLEGEPELDGEDVELDADDLSLDDLEDESPDGGEAAVDPAEIGRAYMSENFASYSGDVQEAS